MTPQEIAFLFRNRRRFPKPLPNKIFGRILRGMTPEDFVTMSPDINRRTVLAYGCDGIAHLRRKTGYDMLIEVGYTHEEIARLVIRGTRFKLIIFTVDKISIAPATWGNVLRIAQQAYPLARAQFKIKYVKDFEQIPFCKLEAEYGERFEDIALRGPTHKLFMTEERLARSAGLVREIRAFLFHTMQLRELFTGDGHTRTIHDDEGVSEYILLNRSLADLDHVLLDLEVTLPNTGA